MDQKYNHSPEIQAILTQIRAELAQETPSAPIPDFESIPLPQEREPLPSERMEKIIGDNIVPSEYPVAGGNPPARLYKNLSAKLTRGALFPLTQRLSKTNYDLKVAIVTLAQEIEAQKGTIEELSARVEFLECSFEAAPVPERKEKP
ncbi:MAG: hypothetical protein IJ188_05230 [Clostridia bacterium]|nr:hypothetical protein [Clostridia bacterium]